jgi:NAD(P)-dependent dehydrogenase (short-subunit alcohol dehydrogenase family)
MLQQRQGGNIVLVTHVLGERGLRNTSVYAAAHGAVHNLIRALAQEIAPHGISINGIALGWMEWMGDRLDRTDEEANRALRFPIIKRAGIAADVGPIAVWLAGTAIGYVTGQLFPVDGGLTQHL